MYELKGSLNPADFRSMVTFWVILASDEPSRLIQKQAHLLVPRLGSM
jgi:hypothetical protein